MKVIILTALKEWIFHKIKFGQNLWQQIAEEAGFGIDRFTGQDSLSSVARLQGLLQVISKKIALSIDDIQKQFLEYWLTDFAPRLYQSLIRQADSTKDFMLNITKVNNEVCNLFPKNNIITRVDLSEIQENVFSVFYGSEKSLVDIVSVLRGASSIFNDSFSVKKINPRNIEIWFNRK